MNKEILKIQKILEDEDIKESIIKGESELKSIIENSSLMSILDTLFKDINGVIKKEKIMSLSDDETIQNIIKSYLELKGISIIDKEENNALYEDDYEEYYTEDTLKSYLIEIRKKPLLSKEEERKLIILKESGNEEAKRKLIEHSLRLVVFIAKRYLGKGVPFLDLIQEGNLGLITAVEKLESSFDCQLSTYATWWIRSFVERAIKTYARPIRLPFYLEESNDQFMKKKNELVNELGREPSIEEIIAKTNFTKEKIKLLLDYTRPVISLDRPLSDDNDDYDLTNLISSDAEEKIEKDIMAEALENGVEKILKSLTTREKTIIMMRVGLVKNYPMTLEEVGNELHITRERVRQIEAKALRKLRHPRNTKKIKDFVDY